MATVKELQRQVDVLETVLLNVLQEREQQVTQNLNAVPTEDLRIPDREALTGLRPDGAFADEFRRQRAAAVAQAIDSFLWTATGDDAFWRTAFKAAVKLAAGREQYDDSPFRSRIGTL